MREVRRYCVRISDIYEDKVGLEQRQLTRNRSAACMDCLQNTANCIAGEIGRPECGKRLRSTL